MGRHYEDGMRHLIAALSIAFLGAVVAEAAERPNVVWIMSEDNSMNYLKLYDEHGAVTPNIEALARHGLVFNHAFSNAPVCSVARTTLITGCYGPRIGTQYHRRSELAAMPEGLKMFPAYLREAGYYTTNNSKEDYNAVKSPDTWDDSSKNASWRGRRAPDQPFFHVQTYTESHESSLHFSPSLMEKEPTKTDPATVTLAPYHPDTPVFRYTHARYLDRMGVIDQKVGELVAQLSEDGLLEDTFIFYFGDHGGVLPRGKGYTYESGLHVPLVVRVPEKWQHLVDAGAGSRVDGFVSFIDFGPTVLKLAGLDPPPQVDGKPFLGAGISMEEVNRRDEAFGYADRMDEKYEMTRTLRKGRFVYHRNYEGFYPDGLQNNYRYEMLAYQDWRARYTAGELNAVQSQFFEPKPAEALYDLSTDPYEVHNLAGAPEQAATLRDLRGRLQNRIRAMPDLSFFPEHVLVEEAMGNPTGYGKTHLNEIGRLAEVADLALLTFSDAAPKLATALQSTNPWERYWGLTSCCQFGKTAQSLAPTVEPLLKDPVRLVRVRAAVFLAVAGGEDPRPVIMEALANSNSPVETLIIFNMVVYLRDFGPRTAFAITAKDVKAPGGEVGRRLFYLTGEGAPKGGKGKGKGKQE